MPATLTIKAMPIHRGTRVRLTANGSVRHHNGATVSTGHAQDTRRRGHRGERIGIGEYAGHGFLTTF
ncbi:MAG: hypothetical protein ACRD0P_22570, partial [Stackebrandtia sp.]